MRIACIWVEKGFATRLFFFCRRTHTPLSLSIFNRLRILRCVILCCWCCYYYCNPSCLLVVLSHELIFIYSNGKHLDWSVFRFKYLFVNRRHTCVCVCKKIQTVEMMNRSASIPPRLGRRTVYAKFNIIYIYL